MEAAALAARTARADALQAQPQGRAPTCKTAAPPPAAAAGGAGSAAEGGDDAAAAERRLAVALAELERWSACEEELTLAFAPEALSAEQRNLVRMKAVALGHKGKSKGGGQVRHLVVTKAQAEKQDEPGRGKRRQRGADSAQPELQPEAELGPSLVTGDNEDPQSSVVFLRKIPRSVGRLELMALGAQFGTRSALCARASLAATELHARNVHAGLHTLGHGLTRACGVGPRQAQSSTLCCSTGAASACCSWRALRRRQPSSAIIQSARW